MEKDVGKIKVLKVDGGASNNNFLMQFQSDIMDTVISRPVITETTGLGVAYLAGLATGAYKSLDDISANWVKEKEFVPTMDKNLAKSKLAGWEKAVEKSKSWEA